MTSSRERCLRLAADSQWYGEWLLRGDGIDAAYSERLFCEARAFRRVAEGEDVEAVLREEDARFRAYAAEYNARARTNRKRFRPKPGSHWPTSNHYVDPNAFAYGARHICAGAGVAPVHLPTVNRPEELSK